MGVPSELFDDDYLYFYGDVLGPQRSDADAALISELLSLRTGMRVLDAPCGEGRISGRLAGRGCEVVGIDASERFLAIARDRYPGVTFEHRDIRDRDANVIADRVSYDAATRRSRTERFMVRDGRVRKLEFSLEQVPAPELVRRLRRAGFEHVDLRGDGGATFDPDSRRLIAIAQRPGPGVAPERPVVSLREVDAANVRAVCDLELAPGQRTYVAPAAYTLAEAQHDERARLRVIYAGDEVVGLLALIADTDPPSYWLARLLVGAQHQHRGFGRAAIALLIDHVRSLPGAHNLETSCAPGPATPKGFYTGLGFEPTGEVRGGEELLRLKL